MEENKWSNLLNYYIACLERERLEDLTFSLKEDGERFISNFSNEMFFCKPNPEIKIEKVAALSGFLRKAQTGGSRKRFYYGYPLLLRRISTRYSRPFFKIASLFFVEVTIEEDKDSNQFILTQKEYLPNLNYAALKGADFTYDQIEALLNEAWPEELITENISPEKSFLLLLNKLKDMTGLKEI